jgi:drug/metabolite transporter (DMT)-like permease
VTGVVFGFLGVLIFSFTLPMTHIAVAQLQPLFISNGRAVVAGALAVAVLLVTRQRRPHGRQWLKLVVVALGVVFGFPLFTSFGLQTVPSSHGAVVIGLLPAATAVVAVIRARERPSVAFWLASGAGVLSVIGFIALSNGAFGALRLGDLLLLGSVVAASIGYAEGALLSRELGSWQTICWALVISLPVTIPVTLATMSGGWPQADPQVWLAFGYMALFSMFLGFLAWYRGLAIGPIARISQIQLVQPVLTILWSALLIGEKVDWLVWVGALVVVLFAAIAVRSRVRSVATTVPSSD